MKGTSGGNGGGKKEKIKQLSPEEKRAKSLRERKAHYYSALIVEMLGIEPTKEEECTLFIKIDGFVYDLAEVFKRAVEAIEGGKK